MARKTFTEQNATEIVLGRMGPDINPRLREVMTSIISHVHAIVREVEPTPDEWMQAIMFLTRTGQMCDDVRQEFILLSDTMGVSMLVDSINNRKQLGGTESTVLGPFYAEGSPVLSNGANIALAEGGDPCFLSGRVLRPEGKPIANARLDVWQSGADGFYNVQKLDDQPKGNLRGVFHTDADGRWSFQTIVPASYPVPDDGTVGTLLRAMGRHPWRPAHVHFIVSAPGCERLTTHLFVNGDKYLESDTVFGVKDSLIVDFVKHDDPAEMRARGVEKPFYVAEYDFVLEPAATTTAATRDRETVAV
jgi:protocatechuate 3,4-dioxygenase beta subunit